MKQLTLLLFLAATTLPALAQEITETQYFDKMDDSTGKENAFTYTVKTFTDTSKKVYTSRSYSMTGQLRSVMSFRDSAGRSLNEGDFIFYHDNGQLKIKARYIGSKLNGTVTTWYANGQIKRKDEYVLDSLISGHCYTATGKDTVWFTFYNGFSYGKNMQELYRFFGKNIRYPKKSVKARTQGEVHIEFIIEKDGTVTHEAIRRSVNEEIDAEALRVFRALPSNWKPALVDGEPYKSYGILPVVFRFEQ
jgi:periplasmic protein TonB